MKLYGTPPTRVLRGLWVLNELGIDCEVVPVDLRKGEHLTPEFRALNPAAKVPVLVDGDTVITESMAIPLYLAEKYPERGLIPRDLQQRAQMYRWLFFLVSEIEAPLWRIARNSFIYPPERRQPEDVKLASEEGREMIAVLESHMAHRDVMVGDSLTLADLMAAYTLDWAHEVGLLEHAPNLRRYLSLMYERPTAPPTIKEALAAQEAEAS